MACFRATFDLSLDDIQRTLSASMPSDLDMSHLEAGGERHDQAVLLDALHCLDDFDFDGLEVGHTPAGSPGGPPDSKLQRADGDQPPPPPAAQTPPPVGEPPPAAQTPAAGLQQLEDLAPGVGRSSRHPSRQQSPHPLQEGGPQQRLGSPAGPASLPTDPPDTSPVKSEADKSCVNMEYREGTANITDFSPEWAYPEVSARDGRGRGEWLAHRHRGQRTCPAGGPTQRLCYPSRAE